MPAKRLFRIALAAGGVALAMGLGLWSMGTARALPPLRRTEPAVADPGLPERGAGQGQLRRETLASLSSTPSWTATGAAAGSYLGWSVATAGDVNGDGYADLVVGAYSAADNAGQAYVYHGGSGGLGATPVFTATGTAEGDNFGRSVATAGDVNGDGYADVAVGACNASSGRGRVTVYAGGAAGLGATPIFTAAGSAVNDYFGHAVASAGDVNGDGYADLAVGACGHDGSRGKVTVYGGGAGGLGATPIFTATGGTGGDCLGYVVASAGDVNGDGYADLAVGSPSAASGAGLVTVYGGGAAGLGVTPTFTATGAAGDDFGVSVATAGDVDGDGYADLIVGADDVSGDAGQAVVYAGGAGGLDPSPILVATGRASYDMLGTSVAAAGDVNGDGYADVAIGAPGVDSSRGQAYVYHGGGGQPGLTPLFSSVGMCIGDRFGIAVATAGDVNGDGYADVMLGGDSFCGAGSDGRAYVHRGGPGSWDFFLNATGGSSGDHLGAAVATAGDVNGDGYADVAIGAPGRDGSRGRVTVYAGEVGGLGATPVLTITGGTFGDDLGAAVASAGDVNGDGYADLAVGAPGCAGDAGRVIVYAGGPSGLRATPIFTATGGTAGDRFGSSVGTAGDVDGDGYAELVVGAPGYAYGAGRVTVYAGGASGLSAAPVFTATGQDTPCWQSDLGWSAGTAGDVNGDGYADLAIGAPGHQDAGGRVTVYAGGPAGLGATPIFTATGNTGDLLGTSVGAAGDVDGDGYADLVVGAEQAVAGKGAVYVFPGGPGGPGATPIFYTTGSAAGDEFGHSVGTAGDVDGDGYADLIVGAPGHSSGHGRAVVYGGNGGGGRVVLAGQARGDGGAGVQPWGLAGSSDAFLVRVHATSPLGRSRVSLQVHACPPGVPFGHATCGEHTAAAWTDVTTATAGVTLTETITVPRANTLYRWRARVLYAPYSVTEPGIAPPPNPAHGPWRRLLGQALEADLRTDPQRVHLPLVLRSY